MEDIIAYLLTPVSLHSIALDVSNLLQLLLLRNDQEPAFQDVNCFVLQQQQHSDADPWVPQQQVKRSEAESLQHLKTHCFKTAPLRAEALSVQSRATLTEGLKASGHQVSREQHVWSVQVTQHTHTLQAAMR